MSAERQIGMGLRQLFDKLADDLWSDSWRARTHTEQGNTVAGGGSGARIGCLRSEHHTIHYE